MQEVHRRIRESVGDLGPPPVARAEVGISPIHPSGNWGKELASAANAISPPPCSFPLRRRRRPYVILDEGRAQVGPVPSASSSPLASTCSSAESRLRFGRLGQRPSTLREMATCDKHPFCLPSGRIGCGAADRPGLAACPEARHSALCPQCQGGIP